MIKMLFGQKLFIIEDYFIYTEYLKHYFDNLNPDFLFIKGDGNPKFSTQTLDKCIFGIFRFSFWEFYFYLEKKRKTGGLSLYGF